MNRTIDYASKNDGKYVLPEDYRKIERELELLDEKVANAHLALDRLRLEIKKEHAKENTDYSYIKGISFAVTTIEAEINKIIRRRK
jgi:hypothetical protein